MAEDNVDRANEQDAEHEAEIEEELERIDRDPDEVDAGDSDLGTQNAPREEVDDLEDLGEAEGVDDIEVEAEEEEEKEEKEEIDDDTTED